VCEKSGRAGRNAHVYRTMGMGWGSIEGAKQLVQYSTTPTFLYISLVLK
jgi:hypothetical protein